MFAILRELIGRRVLKFMAESNEDPEKRFRELVTRILTITVLVTIYAVGVTGRYITSVSDAREVTKTLEIASGKIQTMDNNLAQLFNITADQQKRIELLIAENNELKDKVIACQHVDEKLGEKNKELNESLKALCRKEELE